MSAVGVSIAAMLLAAQPDPAGAAAIHAAPATVPEADGTYGPRYHPPKPEPKPVAAPAPDPVCQSREQQGQIVICAPRPQGYRLNPDVMEAKREKRSGGAPRPPEYRTRDNSCATVGPMGCLNVGINLVGAALTAVTMAEKAIKGENVGKMFITDPHPDEYQLYLMAKARREAREAEEAAQAKAKAAGAAASNSQPTQRSRE